MYIHPHFLHNTSVNLNLPIETPEALKEFNKLITQDTKSLLQYVSIFYRLNLKIKIYV